jgi:glucokinase
VKSKARAILALDFGGTKLAAATVLPGEKHWLALRRAFSPAQANAETDLHLMRSLIEDLLQDCQPIAIGVSFGGPVNAAIGEVRLSHHVPGWENMPLCTLLSEEFGVPVSVDNDANVAALGEYRFGAGQECNSLMYITISTGVGGGLILNGQPWRGAEGMAGEIGHTVIDPDGPLCLCGKRGCLERLASGPYIAQQARELVQSSPSRGQGVRDLVGNDLGAITAQLVSQAADQGDDLACEVLETAGWALGVSIGNVANLINPQRFLLGGGVTQSGDRFWATVRRVARETALPEVHFEVMPAALGGEAPLWGAVALAHDLVGASQ